MFTGIIESFGKISAIKCKLGDFHFYARYPFAKQIDCKLIFILTPSVFN